MSSIGQAREAKRIIADRLANDSRILGIGLSKRQGTYVVQVRLREEVEPDLIPTTIQVDAGMTEVSVHAEIVGSIRPQD